MPYSSEDAVSGWCVVRILVVSYMVFLGAQLIGRKFRVDWWRLGSLMECDFGNSEWGPVSGVKGIPQKDA